MKRKRATLLHNPGAGEGEISKNDLLEKVEAAGFECSYSSTKQFRWENIDTDTSDFLILAGGDGTVRKVVEELLARKVIEKKPPLALLPLGTANNIAKTLQISGSPGDIISAWGTAAVKNFDVGVIKGFDESTFFLESFGYGLFPKLIREMKRQKKNDLPDAKERLQAALEILHEMILKSPVKRCNLQVGGKDYSGKFLLVEVMNTRSIGPNLHLAPHSDPGDGEFEVVLIRENQRASLAEYVSRKLQGIEAPFDFPTMKCRDMAIEWQGRHVHVDDEYLNVEEPGEVKIEMRAGLLEFLVPA